MSFGRKTSETGGGQRMTALVVTAESPLDNLVKAGKRARGIVRIVIETGSKPIYAAGSFKLDKDHWLVPGMEVTVVLDPSRPDDFEVAWEAVPSIEERVAADDPALTDPIGTRLKVANMIKSVTATVDAGTLPDGMRQIVERSQGRKEGGADHFKEALARAQQEPGPPGKERAVVLIATTTSTLVTKGTRPDGSGGHKVRTSEGKHDAVLSVNVPGRAPYAVFKQGFKRPNGKGDIEGSGLPALVSSIDPTDVEVLWDELPSVQSQLSERLSTGMQDMQAAAEGIGGGDADLMQQAWKNAGVDPSAQPPPTAPAQAPGATPQVPAQMREMMIKNAKMALQAAPPAMRGMLIQQYRMAGLTIDEDGNVAE